MDMEDQINEKIEKHKIARGLIEEHYKKGQISYSTFTNQIIRINTTINTLKWVLLIMD